MKNLFLVLSGFLLLSSQAFGQIDYTFSMPVPDVVTTLCESGNSTGQGIAIFITDSGTNGLPTYYEFFSTDGMTISMPNSGFINDASSSFVGSIVSAPGLSTGAYTATVRASSDATFATDVITHTYMFNVRDEPTASIATPDGNYACDGGTIDLEGDAGPGVTASFSWSPGGETTEDITVGVEDTYTLTVSNFCGTDTESVDVFEGSAPILDSYNCNASGSANAINVFVDAIDPDDIGLTFIWKRNGVVIVDGGDFSINTNLSTNKSTLMVSNVQANHVGAQFECFISNACGEIVTPSCSNLPVELLYFSGRLEGEEVYLNWATASEVNSDYFEVERSIDGVQFEAIGLISAAGNSFTETQYDFLDRSPFDLNENIVYYRLRQVDQDDSFTYTNIISVQRSVANILDVTSVYAGEGVLTINLYSPSDKELNVQVFNLNGQRISHQSVISTPGFTQLYLDDVHLPKGFFILHLSSGNQSDVIKFTN